MPLTMKIQPVDCSSPECFEPVKTVPKSRLRRLFDFSSFLRGSAVVDRSGAGAGETQCGKDLVDEFEPSSVCLDKMVQSFIEESSEKQPVVGGTTRCGRKSHLRCNSGNGEFSSDGSEDEFDSFNCFGNSISSSADAYEPLKSLVLCETVFERNLLADVAKIVDKNKICKKKDGISRKIVTDGLLAAGYSVSICKSRWEKTSTYPAGEYEYIDVITDGDRVIVDIDFKSEFEIARSTKNYRAVLQILPHIFVGKPDRLQNIINIVSDAAKQSLKKKGMPLPPWRRADYVKAKWLSPCNRIVNNPTDDKNNQSVNEIATKPNPNPNPNTNPNPNPKDPVLTDEFPGMGVAEEAVKQWEPLEIKPKVPKTGGKVVSGLASVFEGE